MDASERRRAAFRASFDFPLNVYVAALQLEHGKVPDSLHYGLWQDGFTLDQAQEAATELVFEHLDGSGRILEAGVGLGTTALRLVNAGYDYTGVCPDPGQIANTRDLVGKDRAQFAVSKFEDYEPDEPYDIVLFQESAQYLVQVELLKGARGHLKAGGQLLIIDESPSFWFEHLHDRAGEIGFEVTTQTDLTEQAAPSVRYLHDVIVKHFEPIVQTLRLRRPVMVEFCEELRQRWDDYQSGKHKYVLLELRAQ